MFARRKSAGAQALQHSVRLFADLSAALKKNGAEILSGDAKLTLNSWMLMLINKELGKFYSLEAHRTDGDFVVLNSDLLADGQRLSRELQILHDFVQKAKCVKIVHGDNTLVGHLNVSQFTGCCELELKRVPLHLVEGLSVLQRQLKRFTCSRCVSQLAELFHRCGGDQTDEERVWSSLVAVDLSYNDIERLDSSIRLIRRCESLNLSHNRLLTVDRYLVELDQLKFLNLGFNHLRILPELSMPCYQRLISLSLRNNGLTDLQSLEFCYSLCELDVSYNCLFEHIVLEPLRHLRNLSSLRLYGNALAAHKHHRALTLAELDLLSPQTFLLDDRNLSKQEIAAYKRCSFGRESVHTLPSVIPAVSQSPTTSFDSRVLDHSMHNVLDLSTNTVLSDGSLNLVAGSKPLLANEDAIVPTFNHLTSAPPPNPIANPSGTEQHTLGVITNGDVRRRGSLIAAQPPRNEPAPTESFEDYDSDAVIVMSVPVQKPLSRLQMQRLHDSPIATPVGAASHLSQSFVDSSVPNTIAASSSVVSKQTQLVSQPSTAALTNVVAQESTELAMSYQQQTGTGAFGNVQTPVVTNSHVVEAVSNAEDHERRNIAHCAEESVEVMTQIDALEVSDMTKSREDTSGANDSTCSAASGTADWSLKAMGDGRGGPLGGGLAASYQEDGFKYCSSLQLDGMHIRLDTESEALIVYYLVSELEDSFDPDAHYFLTVTDRFLLVRDLHAQITEYFDRETLLRVNAEPFQGRYLVRLSFDYMHKSKRERTFVMENPQLLLDLLSDQLKPPTPLLIECLKCSCKFEVDLRTTIGSIDTGLQLELKKRQYLTLQRRLRCVHCGKLNALLNRFWLVFECCSVDDLHMNCPRCHSDQLIELDQSDDRVSVEQLLPPVVTRDQSSIILDDHSSGRSTADLTGGPLEALQRSDTHSSAERLTGPPDDSGAFEGRPLTKVRGLSETHRVVTSTAMPDDKLSEAGAHAAEPGGFASLLLAPATHSTRPLSSPPTADAVCQPHDHYATWGPGRAPQPDVNLPPVEYTAVQRPILSTKPLFRSMHDLRRARRSKLPPGAAESSRLGDEASLSDDDPDDWDSQHFGSLPTTNLWLGGALASMASSMHDKLFSIPDRNSEPPPSATTRLPLDKMLMNRLGISGGSLSRAELLPGSSCSVQVDLRNPTWQEEQIMIYFMEHLFSDSSENMIACFMVLLIERTKKRGICKKSCLFLISNYCLYLLRLGVETFGELTSDGLNKIITVELKHRWQTGGGQNKLSVTFICRLSCLWLAVGDATKSKRLLHLADDQYMQLLLKHLAETSGRVEVADASESWKGLVQELEPALGYAGDNEDRPTGFVCASCSFDGRQPVILALRDESVFVYDYPWQRLVDLSAMGSALGELLQQPVVNFSRAAVALKRCADPVVVLHSFHEGTACEPTCMRVGFRCPLQLHQFLFAFGALWRAQFDVDVDVTFDDE